MKRQYEYFIGPVSVDTSDGLQIEKDVGLVRKAFVFPNGMVVAFGKDDQQIESIQGPLWELLEELWDHKNQPGGDDGK